MREKLLNVATVVVVACTVLVTALFVKRELTGHTPTRSSRPTKLKDWQTYAREGRQIGPANAPVTIVAFSDYQCPYCRVLARTLDTLRNTHPADIRVIYRHFPLESAHPFARQAAIAAECAGEQGRFEALHDTLFVKQDSIGTLLGSSRLAELAGIRDTAAFSRCRKGGTAGRRIDGDMAQGQRLQIIGTPTVIVNGWRFDGAPTLAMFDSIVGAVLQKDDAKAHRGP
ncbi:MAG: DsbA family protein [Gemmatimonadaceae bacterium]